jgi:hypothetical protein
MVGVLMRDQDGVSTERGPLAEHAGVDDQHGGVGFDPDAGVRVLDQPHCGPPLCAP